MKIKEKLLFDSTYYKKSNLVYTVNPLSTSLLNFVFDSQYDFLLVKLNNDEMVSIAEKVIFESHSFIRRNNDESEFKRC